MNSEEFIIENATDDEADMWCKKLNIPLYDVMVALKIKKMCQPFLKQCKNDPFILYRGVVGAEHWSIHKRVRLDDRKPLSSKIQLHRAVNNFFVEHYHEPFRNAMFCTGDYNDAVYGDNTYFAFPVGNFNYIWSPDIDDMYMIWQKWIYNQGIEDNLPNGIIARFIDEVIAKANWHQNNIRSASQIQTEIMIRCKEYIGIEYDYDMTEELTQVIMS